jgi:hypothetical protein
MRRPSPALSLALASLLALALAGPALAWDSVDITITAPTGVGTTSDAEAAGPPVSGHGGDVIDMLLISSPMDGRPSGDLGPRFVITYSFPFDGHSSSVAQDLYPYAPGGPLAYSAADGSIVGHAIRAGWHEGNTALLRVFVSWGLPATANVAPAVANDGAAQSAGEATRGEAAAAAERTRMLTLALLAAGLVVVAIVGRERRRLTATPAPA